MNYAYPLPSDSFPKTAEITRKEFFNKEILYQYINPSVIHFIEQHVELAYWSTKIMNTSSILNIENIYDGAIENFVNIRRINDVSLLNKFLETVNKKLPFNGIYVGCADTKRFIKDRILKSHSKALLLPEILGRLIYCGFEIVKYKKLDGMLYFVVKKIREPLGDKEPPQGTILKMKRIGKDQKSIYVYKVRTMYPYSEYLQQYIYEQYGTINGDKPANDFRVTRSGRILRKLWIDELPMFLNFLKGELKLVGVRPISHHKFNMYPEDLQKKRVKYKPGLIPPFYAELPTTQEEFFRTEERYLDEYEKNPLITDLKYFLKACYNIFVLGARSA